MTVSDPRFAGRTSGSSELLLRRTMLARCPVDQLQSLVVGTVVSHSEDTVTLAVTGLAVQER